VTNFASITQQEIIRLIASHAPLVVHDLLIKEYSYVSLEGSGLSEIGAYFIHPIDWPKPDISSAKLCWPAMEKQGLQFIGLNGPSDIKFYDGLLDGKPCELKFIKPKAEIKTQDKLVTNIKEHLLKANRQGAEIAIVVVSNVVSPEKFNWDQIQSRIDGSISKQYHTLKRGIILTEK
jgi:hypothetical protein